MDFLEADAVSSLRKKAIFLAIIICTKHNVVNIGSFTIYLTNT